MHSGQLCLFAFNCISQKLTYLPGPLPHSQSSHPISHQVLPGLPPKCLSINARVSIPIVAYTRHYHLFGNFFLCSLGFLQTMLSMHRVSMACTGPPLTSAAPSPTSSVLGNYTPNRDILSCLQDSHKFLLYSKWPTPFHG